MLVNRAPTVSGTSELKNFRSPIIVPVETWDILISLTIPVRPVRLPPMICVSVAALNEVGRVAPLTTSW